MRFKICFLVALLIAGRSAKGQDISGTAPLIPCDVTVPNGSTTAVGSCPSGWGGSMELWCSNRAALGLSFLMAHSP